jgi:hypothetical protein
MKDYTRTIEYFVMSGVYGDKTTERSGVRLMNHIDEGIEIMVQRGASVPAIKAYILHPIFQSDEALTGIINYETWNDNSISFLDADVIIRAMEYRRAANAYLCKPSTDNWSLDEMKESIGLLLPDIREMLIADKLQNQKDFLLYHKGTHARSDQLDAYFKNWLIILDLESETETETA